MGWLVVSLPNRLQQLETQITQILSNQNQFGLRFQELEKQVTDLDRRTIRLELNR
jgi:exonuclease VII small subunit